MNPEEARQAGRKPVITVLMEHLSSEEFVFPENGEPKRILEDISLMIRAGETWAVSGLAALEVRLLLEIMGNIRPYGEGRCVLAERGMMRKKRIILHHVFYIGGTDMLYDDMNVLEYLMFVLNRRGGNSVLLQDELFEYLIGIGLGRISLTPVRLLDRAEKAVVTLVAASRSDSLLIVFNFPELRFDEALTGAVRRVSEDIRADGRTLVIGTNDCRLAEKACTHAAFLAESKIIYSGTVSALRRDYDPVEFVIRGDGLLELGRRLAPLLPGYSLEFDEDGMQIVNRQAVSAPRELIYQRIIETGTLPEAVEVRSKTVRNAYRELLRLHDLQSGLF